MFTTYVLLTFLTVLMYFLIRTVVMRLNNISQKKQIGLLRLLKIRTMWVDEEGNAVISESDEALNILSE